MAASSPQSQELTTTYQCERLIHLMLTAKYVTCTINVYSLPVTGQGHPKGLRWSWPSGCMILQWGTASTPPAAACHLRCWARQTARAEAGLRALLPAATVRAGSGAVARRHSSPRSSRTSWPTPPMMSLFSCALRVCLFLSVLSGTTIMFVAYHVCMSAAGAH
jgi:hypothetical protein